METQPGFTAEQRKDLQMIRSKCIMLGIFNEERSHALKTKLGHIRRCIALILSLLSIDVVVSVLDRLWVRIVPDGDVYGLQFGDIMLYVSALLILILSILYIFENPTQVINIVNASKAGAGQAYNLSARIYKKMNTNGLPPVAYLKILEKIREEYSKFDGMFDKLKSNDISSVMKRITTVPPELSRMTVNEAKDIPSEIRNRLLKIIDNIRGSKKELAMHKGNRRNRDDIV